MRARFQTWLLVLLGAALVLSACSGSSRPVVDPLRPDSDGVPAQVIAAEGARFVTGALPFGWRRLLTGDAKAGFMNQIHGQAIMVNVVYAPNRRADLTALRNHLLFDLTEREILEHELIEVDHRESLWTVVEGRMEGARIKMALAVVRIDDWVYDLAYVSTPAQFDVCLPDFKTFLTAFHQKRNYRPVE